MKKIILMLVSVLCPQYIFAQDGDFVSWEKGMEYMDGGNILEDWFMKVFMNEYREVILAKWDVFVSVAVALAGLFALVYFSMKAYEMLTGDQEMRILPLLKPFLLCMLIFNWHTFIVIIDAPVALMAKEASKIYEEAAQETNAYRYKKTFYQRKLIDHLFEEAVDAEIAQTASEKSFWDAPWETIKDSTIDYVLKPLMKAKMKMDIGIQQIITQLLELLSLWILRICVYLVFSLQMIYSCILILLGPITVAFSILPWFADALKSWLARYISVQLYLIIGFLVLTVVNYLQQIALTAEIDRFSEVMNSDGSLKSLEVLMWINSNGILSFGMVIVSFLVSAIAILSVPKISTWILATSGAVGALGAGSRAVTTAVTRGLK